MTTHAPAAPGRAPSCLPSTTPGPAAASAMWATSRPPIPSTRPSPSPPVAPGSTSGPPREPAGPLARRLAMPLAAVVALLAGGLLALAAWIGTHSLERDHEASGLRMAALFEASLRHAMLSRDLDGLRSVLRGLGAVPGLRSIVMTTVDGEVRFASDPALLGRSMASDLAGLCLTARCGALSAPRVRPGDGATGTRVVHPVRNADACVGCHGRVDASPVNGVLVLELDPPTGQRLAWRRAGTELLPAALLALAIVGATAAWLVRRQVLRPLSQLREALARFGRGEPDARSNLPADTSREIATLGRGFDTMARQVREHTDAMATQRRFLQSLIDAAPDAMLVIGEDHRIVAANTAYAKLLGRLGETIVGTACHATSRGRAEPCPPTMVSCPLAHQLALHRAERGIDIAAVDGMPSRHVMALRHADGRSIDVEIDAAALAVQPAACGLRGVSASERPGPLTGPQGARMVVQVIRRLDAQVRFSQEQRLSAIGMLANGVAHEVHNPLGAIRLALQACQRGIEHGSMPKDELVDYLKLVDTQIDRCVSTTQRLMRMSQPPSTLAQPVGVKAAIDDVTGLLAEEARRAKVAIDVAVVPAALRASTDDAELRQVVLNLCQNAIHAMPGGGTLTIRARREPPAGDPVRVPAGTMVLLSVADDGTGIDPAVQSLIFLPFFSRRGDGQHGTGLGLAIVKGIVEARGGSISVTSEPGRGSRFEVRLPDADSDDAADSDDGAGHGGAVGSSDGREHA